MESNHAKPQEYGQQIRYLRKKAGITQTQLAKRAGISLNSVQRYEKNERQPNVQILFQIANALGATFSDLVLGETKEKYLEQISPEEEEIKEEYARKLYWDRISTIYYNLTAVSSGTFAETFSLCFPQLNSQGQAKVQTYLEDIAKIVDYHKDPIPRPKTSSSYKVAPFIKADNKDK